jgi:hypothetical protein
MENSALSPQTVFMLFPMIPRINNDRFPKSLNDWSFFQLVAGGVQLGPLSTAATDWPIVACPG